MAQGRAVALTILEGALCAALKPLTLLLPAAAGLFALREVWGAALNTDLSLNP